MRKVVRIPGSTPYGFRLVGGDGEVVTVARVSSYQNFKTCTFAQLSYNRCTLSRLEKKVKRRRLVSRKVMRCLQSTMSVAKDSATVLYLVSRSLMNTS